MKTNILLSIAIMAGGIISGCKFPGVSQSSKKSIDAVQTGDQSRRSSMVCGPGSMPTSNVSEAVQRSYAALPAFLQVQFSNLENSFRVSETVGEDCLKSLKAMPSTAMSSAEQAMIQDNRLQSLKACWVSPVVAGDESREPRIVMNSNVQDIHNSMIATTFYAFAEWYMDRVIGPALDSIGPTDGKDLGTKGPEIVNLLKKFREARKFLAEAVIADLTTAGSKEVIAKYEQDFGAPAASLASNVAFQNFVSAEFTDTWYCNLDTRQSLMSSPVFPKARDAYAAMAKVLGKAWFEE